MKISSWRLGSTSPEPVPEFAAEGDTARVYHEIRQSLRVTGVDLIFRTWAGFEKFFPVMWDEVRPNVETTVFEEAANQIRDEALRSAESFSPAPTGAYAALGESRTWQIRAALDLYHYINPKLLVLTSAVAQALQGERIGSGAAGAGRLARGEPAKMYPMEMEAENPDEKAIRRLFKDIRKTLSLPSITSDYRTLALWPDYLELVWNRLKPLARSPEFQQAADQLRDHSRALARTLPYPISLTLGRIKELGEDPDRVLETTRTFEQLLPGLILNIAVLQLDWSRAGTEQRGSHLAPGAAPPEGAEPAWRAFQRRQRLVELGDRFASYIDEGNGEPVVLLHGIPTWGFLWEQTIAALSHRYRVLVPDLLGFGYSDKRDDFDRSIARQAEMVDGLLAKLGIEAAHCVGHDIGGGTALRLATLFPHRVRSLCLMNSVGYDSWPVESMLQLGNPAGRKVPAAKTLKTLRQAIQGKLHAAPAAEWLDGLVSPWRTEVGKLSLIRDAVALNTNQTTEITRLLPILSAPTLVIWGEDDQLQPVNYGERLAKDIPGAALVRIAGAAHFVMIDQPERVHGVLREFLARQVAQVRRAAA